MEEIKEKRKHQRIKADWPVLVEFEGKAIACRLENISPDGVNIICDEKLPFGEIICLSLKPEGHEIIKFYGKVIWSTIYGINRDGKDYGVGVLFVQKSKIDSKPFDDFVNSLDRESSADFINIAKGL